MNEIKVEWNNKGDDVKIAGSFNNWIPIDMIKFENKWIFKFNTLDKNIQFKFIIDGEWKIDENKEKIIDENGNYNNIIEINKEIIVQKKYNIDIKKYFNFIDKSISYILDLIYSQKFKISPNDDELFLAKHDNNIFKAYKIKIFKYSKKCDIFDIKRSENVEIIMSILLSSELKSFTPNLIPITFCSHTKYDKLKEFYPPKVYGEEIMSFFKKFEEGIYYENISLLGYETVDGYLLNHIHDCKTIKLIHWKSIFFQILSLLSIIQTKFPNFRHNNLITSNLLIKLISLPEGKKTGKYRYYINGSTYIVPFIKFQIKLFNFQWACIPGLVDNSIVELESSKKINIQPIQNRYYDIHSFFNSLINSNFKSDNENVKFFDNTFIPNEVKDFVKRIIPEKYLIGKNVSKCGRILSNDEYLIPDKILKCDPFFKIYRFDYNDKELKNEIKILRDYKINKLIEITKNYINEKEAIAIILFFNIEKTLFLKKEHRIIYLFEKSEEDTLLALQVINKFANEKNICVEDSKIIFNEYMKNFIKV